ncbi:MAG: sigma-54-dependent Fis family transcriptional regulator [Thermomicrobiales bacterium]|nr:MAG: sigma-54-dependent Fis family transcriptional regulator [Thermomicrobiales bacterium]
MHVLVIDDEAAVRQILVEAVSQAGYSVDDARNATEAAAKLVRGDVDVALCDIKMPDGNGVDLMRSIKSSGIETTFVMVTAFASMETAIEALRAGAADYIIKPVNNEELGHRLGQIAALRGLRDENQVLRKFMRDQASPLFRFESGPMAEIDRLVGRVAPTDSTVLITGESGTGKGVVARAIHDRSQRVDAMFLPVNCSAIPEHLLESEFFGHTKGAFTSADKSRKGLFLQADRGTLFLDEIGELPLHMQTKLLHAIEDKEVRPVGSESPRRVDTRIVAATNRNLEDMVREGSFREDLFFRLSMFHLHIPPLRERQTDLRGLIRFVLARARAGTNARLLEMDTEAEELLLGYPWPGNVRQLENVLNRACILADGDHISIADLPPEITRTLAAHVVHGISPSRQGRSLREQLRDIEADIIYKTLEETHGDRRIAASRLGIGLSSLYRKLEEFEEAGIARPSVQSSASPQPQNP